MQRQSFTDAGTGTRDDCDTAFECSAFLIHATLPLGSDYSWARLTQPQALRLLHPDEDCNPCASPDWIT
jgi:hypothetical protein